MGWQYMGWQPIYGLAAYIWTGSLYMDWQPIYGLAAYIWTAIVVKLHMNTGQ